MEKQTLENIFNELREINNYISSESKLNNIENMLEKLISKFDNLIEVQLNQNDSIERLLNKLEELY